MNTFSIIDLEKAIKYAKAQNAIAVHLSMDMSDHNRLQMGISAAYKGSGAVITVFSAESAKMPEITKTETLF